MKALATNREDGDLVIPPEQAETLAETLEDVPAVAPTESAIAPRVRATSLFFHWRPPTPSECTKYNTDLDGSYFILKGIDRWNEAEEQRGGTTGNSKLFQDLRPFSNYVVVVYARDRRGNYNRDVSLRLTARTKPGPPGNSAPGDIFEQSVDLSDRSIRLVQWMPPYPPTGEIQYYTLRWRLANSSIWMNSVQIDPSKARDLCHLDAQQESLCQSVSSLEQEEDYVFQVAYKNKGVLGQSSWTLEYLSQGSTGTIWSSGSRFYVIIGIVGIVLVILVLVVATPGCVYCIRKKKKRYKNVPPYESTYPRVNLSMTTMTTSALNRSASERASFASSIATDRESLRKYQQHLLPSASRPGSIQETPLPPLPGDDEHPYEELHLKRQPTIEEQVSNDEDDSNSAEFLEPRDESSVAGNDTSKTLEEGDYLPPRRKGSVGTLDIDDYLKPTFTQVINPRDMSPPTEAPPPIPIASYVQVNKVETS